MGGQEILHWSTTPAAIPVLAHIDGLICEAPYIRLSPSTDPFRITVILGRLASKLVPKAQMVQKLRAEYLTRDEEWNKMVKADKLCHDTGTLQGLAGMLDRAAGLDNGHVLPGRGIKRLWMGQGTEDNITNFEASKRCFEGIKVEDKTLVGYEGWYHVLHEERGEDKYRFRKDVADWILHHAFPG